MNPTELLTLLSRTFPARLPTLTLGQPGIGKSDIHEQAAAVAGEARRVERLLDDVLADVVTAKDPTVVLLDELGAASPAMQAACAPLLLARRIGRHALPDHVKVVIGPFAGPAISGCIGKYGLWHAAGSVGYHGHASLMGIVGSQLPVGMLYVVDAYGRCFSRVANYITSAVG